MQRRLAIRHNSMAWYLGGTMSVLRKIEKDWGVDTAQARSKILKVHDELAQAYKQTKKIRTR